MYKIDKETNDIIKLDEKMFSELGFKERSNLQEWIVRHPDVLGEELLIIQKEFDGFHDTSERLDLLALDKDGSLVIIENKLDDTGKDVVWQALKYTSYCSTLTTRQIIEIYQKYLDRYETNDLDAKGRIMEFLGIEDEESLLLNDKDQRIIFIAHNYRKEVTSTVVWLLNHDIQIQCFKATPYKLGDDIFLQIEQIIPQPELKEYMIDLNIKEKEDKGRSKKVEETRAELMEFWKMMKEDLKEHDIHLIDNVSPRPQFYMGFHKDNAIFRMVIGRHAPRVEIYFSNDADKKIFDAMQRHKEGLEKQFEGKITWERLEGKKASRIKHDMPKEFHEQMGEWKNPVHIQKRIDWYRENFVKFYDAFYPVWEKVRKELNR